MKSVKLEFIQQNDTNIITPTGNDNVEMAAKVRSAVWGWSPTSICEVSTVTSHIHLLLSNVTY